MQEVLLVLIGGGIGSACRYGVTAATGRILGDGFAWGTLAVNLLGCLLIGFIVGLADRAIVPRTIRILLVTGFLGGFTTFSTFSLESVRMLVGGYIGKGLLDIGLNLVLGLGLTVAGLALATRL